MRRGCKRVAASVLALLCALYLSGCSGTIQEGLSTLLSPDETYEKASNANGYAITDNKALYVELEDQVITMYLTVGRGNEDDGTDHSWSEVNEYPLSYYEENDLEPYMCEAILQVGDEIGPLSGKFGYGELVPNATVRLRGQGASEQTQKSYRIDIKQKKGEWEKQKVVLLNKHASDPFRFRNRLAYSLMAEIPEMFSARTWFVHLYVKDMTEGVNGPFQDYGLYTAVEQINGRYFKNRNLDSNGQLFKAVDFDWYPHEDVLVPVTSPDFDLDAFEQYLETKGNVDNSQLLEIISQVNDEMVPISQIVSNYFDADNLYYWMAFHILIGNRDVATTNYYLYSPQMLSKWYFISWDNDASFDEGYERLRDESYSASWNHGIFSLTSSRLFERILKDAGCRQGLNAAVTDLYENYLTTENVLEKAQKLRNLSELYTFSLPDSMYQRVSQSEYANLFGSLANEVDDNYDAYQRSLEEPWPFHIQTPAVSAGRIRLQWEPAYLFPSGTSIYSIELAESPDFENCIVQEDDYAGTTYDLPMLPTGQYFLRVRAGNGQGDWQDAYEYYITEMDGTVYSTQCFYVLSDGSVEVSQYYEK